MRASTDSRHSLEKYLLVGALLLYAIYIGRNTFFIDGEAYFSLFDDAMISMRYGRNLAEGHGLVWNAGEPPVEGYTNFLWTLIMSAAHLTGLPDSKVSLVVLAISAACLLGNALVVRRIVDLVSNQNPLARLTALGLTLFSYPLIFWSLRGMEVGFLTLLVDLGIWASLDLGRRFSARSLGLLCGACALAMLTRPDSFTPVAVIGAFTVMSTGKARLKVALVLVASLGVTLAAHTALRYFYYHDTLPNTYYLKMSGTPLAARLAVGAPAFVRTLLLELWPLLLPIGVLLIRSPERLADRGRQLLLSLLLTQCAYSVYVGGDAWEQLTFANRYISIALPGAFVLLGTLLGEALDAPSRADLRWVWRFLGGAALVSLLAAALYHFTTNPLSIAHIRIRQFASYAVIDVAIALTSLYAQKEELPGVGELKSWALLLVPLWVALNGLGFGSWQKNHAAAVDEEMSRLGVMLKHAAKPEARIAVTYAGAPPYFSRLPSVDLLGKCDAVVSHEPSFLPFLPGHSKWNYHYSLPTYHPDLILQTMRLGPSERAYFAELGYERLPNGVYISKSSQAVDARAIAQIPFRMHHIFERD